MKAEFPGYYIRSKESFFKELWRTSVFIFDTNMLLNFFRYSASTRDELTALLKSKEVKGRFWVPYQVAKEYHFGINAVRYEALAAAYELRRAIENVRNKTRAESHKSRVADLLKMVDGYVAEEKDKLNSKAELAWVDRVADIFTSVGEPWDDNELKKVAGEGEDRYKKNIPPGFRDAKKGDEKYGDLIIWKQILDYAKNVKPSGIIYVTDDGKEDWWLRQGGETQGPHPLLLNEMSSVAPDVKFYMYSGVQFLNYAKEYLRVNVTDSAVMEARDVSESNRRRNIRHHFFGYSSERTISDAIYLDFSQFVEGHVFSLKGYLNLSWGDLLERVSEYRIELDSDDYDEVWVLEDLNRNMILSNVDSSVLVQDIGVAAGSVLRVRMKQGDKLMDLPLPKR